jgi:iron complex transport system ATP-binding protein
MLEIKSLSVSYGDHLVLDDVSLTIKPGQILVVTGPNGAGKSTLLRAVSGVIPHKHGSMHIAGKDISHLSAAQRARYLAVVPQARNLPAAFSVYQTVFLGRTPYLGWLGMPNAPDHERVHMALERTSTLSLSDRRVGELSGGEQQRVLLARALAQHTPALLLDEPTTHLDLHHQSGLLNLLRELIVQENIAVLMVLHDLNLASLYADEVALLVEGRVRACGSAAQVLTAQNLSAVYNIPVHVVPHPTYGCPLILPDGRLER